MWLCIKSMLEGRAARWMCIQGQFLLPVLSQWERTRMKLSGRRFRRATARNSYNKSGLNDTRIFVSAESVHQRCTTSSVSMTAQRRRKQAWGYIRYSYDVSRGLSSSWLAEWGSYLVVSCCRRCTSQTWLHVARRLQQLSLPMMDTLKEEEERLV